MSKEHEDKQNIRMKYNIRKCQVETGITDEMMARELGIATGTYIHKRLNPDKLRLSELRYIVKRLEMTDAEVMEGLR